MASIRKRGDSYTITAYMGYNNQRKQIRKTTTFHPPENVSPGKAEKLAMAYAVKWEEKIRQYISLDENKTFAELAEWYFTVVAPSAIRESTAIKARNTIDIHIMPILGREKLKNITPAMLDQIFTHLRTHGNTKTLYRLKNPSIFREKHICYQRFAKENGIPMASFANCRKGQRMYRKNAERIAAGLNMKLEDVFEDVTEVSGLQGGTINKLKLNVSAIFTAAVKKEIMLRNPCRLATAPRVDSEPAAFLNEHECRVFLSELHKQTDFQLEVMFNLFLATGMRAGEVFALHWEDVDLASGLLHVHHTLVRLKGEYVRQSPKTHNSDRYIMLPAFIISLLEAHRESQRAIKAAEAEWKVPDAIFTNRKGDYMCASAINPKLKTLLRNAGLPDKLHLHSLRHTHASLLINSDITAKVIADRLGHASTKTTLNVYSHIFAETEAKATQAVEMAIFKPIDEV